MSCLLRRADGAAVIWAGLTASAAGAGHRKIAAGLGYPASTVRGWLARFTSRAELVRGVFTMRLCALDPDPPPLAPAGSATADAVAAVAAAAAAAGRRWAGRLVSLSPGELAWPDNRRDAAAGRRAPDRRRDGYASLAESWIRL